MADLDKEIKAYEANKTELYKNHLGKFVIFYSEKLSGVFDTFDTAASEAVKQFGDGPYLIRQVGVDPPKNLSASVLYRVVHATN